MLEQSFIPSKRDLHTEKLSAAFVVAGGGMSGICVAITAARAGVKTIVVQDRPVLGGNASSEIRLWVLGATSHMGNNNRWSREGGVINEILVENAYRNREGNPIIFDTILLEKVRNEENITLLLNTAVYDIEKSAPDTVSKLYGFCSQNETFYEIEGRIFCDATGDGIVAYRAGAAYRMGAEETETYGELFAPDKARYGELLGHSIYFYTKDTDSPVKFIPPAYALKDITKIPRWNRINAGEHGCKFWWLEYGGSLDTIHDTEEIKWEIWSVVYGVWNHIKNSGFFPEAQNLTLEWVGIIPGKRESRRFAGLYTITQQDIVEQRHHPDAVAFGGWAIDLHPADGVLSAENGCIQYHSKGVYEIPYRCLVSRDISNLFYAGRCMSASHVAHGSTRVMATSAFCGQAVGMAAALCLDEMLLPAALTAPELMKKLQQSLNLAGQSIPHIPLDAESNLASTAAISASSELTLDEIPFDGPWTELDYPAAQMLPMKAGVEYGFEIEVSADEKTDLEIQLRYSSKPFDYTPDVIAETIRATVEKGTERLCFRLGTGLPEDQYGFVVFMKNPHVKLRASEMRMTGILSVFNKFNHAVNNTGRQDAPEGFGIDSFEFWCPDRRPEGRNISMRINPAIQCFRAPNGINGFIRPIHRPNAWVADPSDPCPALTLQWEREIELRELILYFDTDYDHALESVQMGHPENIMPFCVRSYRIFGSAGDILYKEGENHQTINLIKFEKPLKTSRLKIELDHPSRDVPASLFHIEIR